MDNTWRDSNSLLHMSWSTCRGTESLRVERKEKEERIIFQKEKGADFSFFVKWCRFRWCLFVLSWSLGGSLYSVSITSPPEDCLLHMMQLWTLNSHHCFFFFKFFYFIMLKIAHLASVWVREEEMCVLNKASVRTEWDCESMCVSHFAAFREYNGPRYFKESFHQIMRLLWFEQRPHFKLDWTRSGPDSLLPNTIWL